MSSLDQVLRQHTCDLSQSHVVASHSNTYWQLDHCQIIGLPGVISGVWVICVCRSLLQLWHWWLYCNINVPFHNKWPQLYLKFKYSHNFPIMKGISINLNWEFHLNKMFEHLANLFCNCYISLRFADGPHLSTAPTCAWWYTATICPINLNSEYDG